MINAHEFNHIEPSIYGIIAGKEANNIAFVVDFSFLLSSCLLRYRR